MLKLCVNTESKPRPVAEPRQSQILRSVLGARGVPQHQGFRISQEQ